MKWQKFENVPQLSAFFFCPFKKIVVLLPLHKSCNTKDVMVYETKKQEISNAS